MSKSFYKQLEELRETVEQLTNEKWHLYSQVMKMENEYAALKDAYDSLVKDYAELHALYQNRQRQNPRNERGAGRKKGSIKKEHILQRRRDGMTLREISEALQISISTVNRILKA